MKKLHSLAFYIMVTPVIALSSSALFAQQPNDENVDSDQNSVRQDKDHTKSTLQTTQGNQDKQRSGQYDDRTAADHNRMGDKSPMKNRGYLSSAPTNGMEASNLIGASVRTTDDDEVGSVSDLIIDENGQVVAIVVGVGGFLGMGEKDVAIGWGEIETSGTSDDQELRVDVTREELRSAPAFETEMLD